jgi:hypothetical protein
MIQQRVDRPALEEGVSNICRTSASAVVSQHWTASQNRPATPSPTIWVWTIQINVFPSSWMIRVDGDGVLSPVLLKKPAVVAHVSAHAPHRSSHLAPTAQLQQQQH